MFLHPDVNKVQQHWSAEKSGPGDCSQREIENRARRLRVLCSHRLRAHENAAWLVFDNGGNQGHRQASTR